MAKSWISSYENLDNLSFEELKSYLPYNRSFDTKRELSAYWIFKNHAEVIAPANIKQSRAQWLENLYLKFKGQPSTIRDKHDTINDQDIFRHSRIAQWIGFTPYDWNQEEE